MTKQDKIKGHFSAIAECAGNLRRNYDPERVIENDEVTQYLRKQLDTIEKLLSEPEPETLAASVLRLTERCNQLEKELATTEKENTALKQDLKTDEVYVEKLRQELRGKLKQFQMGWCPYENELAELRAEVARQNELLKEAEKYTRQLSRDPRSVERSRRIKYLERARTADVAYIEELKQSLATAGREFALQERYIELLKEERRSLKNEIAYRRNWNLRR